MPKWPPEVHDRRNRIRWGSRNTRHRLKMDCTEIEYFVFASSHLAQASHFDESDDFDAFLFLFSSISFRLKCRRRRFFFLLSFCSHLNHMCCCTVVFTLISAKERAIRLRVEFYIPKIYKYLLRFSFDRTTTILQQHLTVKWIMNFRFFPLFEWSNILIGCIFPNRFYSFIKTFDNGQTGSIHGSTYIGVIKSSLKTARNAL